MLRSDCHVAARLRVLLQIGPTPSRLLSPVQCSINRPASSKLFGEIPCGTFHTPPHLRAIVDVIANPTITGNARRIYRAAKAVELICETARALTSDELVPAIPHSALSPADTARIMKARDIIETRWSAPLTLYELAKACGVNRHKLTWGFKQLTGTSVTEALTAQRLSKAASELRHSDLPISTIGLRNGYQCASAFSRAFKRQYGTTPGEFRLGAKQDVASSNPAARTEQAVRASASPRLIASL